MLILEGCTSLVEVHESIGHLKKLVLLNLQGCENLKNVPESLSNLYSLETLNLSDCLKIDKLPEQMGNMIILTELLADGTDIKQLPYSFVLLKKLKTLSLSGCKGQFLESWMSHFLSWFSRKCLEPVNLLPTFVSGGLCCLTNLNLSDCNLYADGIPNDLESLSLLKKLFLSRNNFRSLPRCIGRLPKLDILELGECTSLQSISELPASLESLVAMGCSSLQRLPNMPNQERLCTNFDLECCNSLAYDFRKSLAQVHSLSRSLSLCLPLSLSHFMM
jgi:Leucine-rich repeat (LRR) protein